MQLINRELMDQLSAENTLRHQWRVDIRNLGKVVADNLSQLTNQSPEEAECGWSQRFKHISEQISEVDIYRQNTFDKPESQDDIRSLKKRIREDAKRKNLPV